jgi:predicted glycosyltransferase involved in capsule biosynthesis
MKIEDVRNSGTNILKSLLRNQRMPSRYKYMGGIFNYVLISRIRGWWLGKNIMASNKNTIDDIAVIIAVKNRYDYRIYNCLNSLKYQDYDSQKIKIIIVDYGSDSRCYEEIKSLENKYWVQLVRVKNKGEWNRSHAINIGIRKCRTKFVLTTDVDMVFEKNYISEAIKQMKKETRGIVLSNMLDTSEGDIKGVIDISRDYDSIKRTAKKRTIGKSINLSFRYYYKRIRGYDEGFKVWGGEDLDIIRRFLMLGLKIINISEKSSYLHQWHPKHEGVKKKDIDRAMKFNRKYLELKGIKRNKAGWGKTN